MSSSEEAEWNGEDDDKKSKPDNDDEAVEEEEEEADEEEEDEDEDEEHEEEEEEDDEDFDDEDAKPSKKVAAKKETPKKVSEDDDDDDDSDDSDDEKPLSELLKTKKKPSRSSSKKRKPAPKKSESAAKKKKKSPAASKAKAATTSKKKSSSSKIYEWPSAALYGTECDKGLLIQRLLCRWWYAYQWPDDETLNRKPPPNYDALDGFKGVYVCTKGDDVGKILDSREEDMAPSFQNFARKPAADLRDLLLKAIQEQKKQLNESAPDPVTEKELNAMEKWATKLNPSKADKDAKKILTANRLDR